MDDEENDPLPGLISRVFNAMAEPIVEAQQELSARLSAQRFLLEVMYANAFRSEPRRLDELMEELIRLTRAAPSRAEPMPDDVAIELQARAATHLQRFQAAVQHRIESGREF